MLCGLDYLGRGTYTAEGIQAIADALKVTASVTEVNLDGFALPIKQLKGIEPVASLDFSGKALGVASAVVIASLIRDNASLTEVLAFPFKSATRLLCLIMHSSFASLLCPCALQLNLSGNMLCGVNRYTGTGTYTAEGIAALAEVLKVTASLTSVRTPAHEPSS